MDKKEKSTENTFFQKLNGFWNKETINKSEAVKINSKEENLNLFSSIKDKFFSSSKDEVSENQTPILSQNLIEVKGDSANSLLETVKGFSSNTIDTIKLNSELAWDYTLIKTAEAKNTSLELSQSISNSFTEFSTDVGKKYDDLEIKPKLLNLIYAVDLIKIITYVEVFKDKQKKESKEKTGLAVIVSILYLLEKSKNKVENKDNLPIQIDNELNNDFETLLKSITLKDVVETVEPFLLIIPNGNYILLILKLFI